ncbi:hypothetical protein DFH09DRAFT_1368230 [Mycena vulgaris]|nr:hypothetical protein DFH09DRAFT_1368230 [Mycena vulgaris]
MSSLDSPNNEVGFEEDGHSSNNVSETQSCQSDGCTLDADLVLRSSDGMLYAAHSKNLELYSGGFPPSSFATVGGDEREIVQLTEASSVLTLLLQFLHNQRQPDSTKFEFERLAGLAEAAEKYMVYSAMEVCKLRMRSSISAHPLEVLAYATKHGYTELRDAAVPATISTPLEKVTTALQHMPEILVAWVKYREGFIHAMHFMFKRPPIVLHRGGLETCELWATFQKEVFDYFERGIAALDRIKQFSAIVSNGPESGGNL